MRAGYLRPAWAEIDLSAIRHNAAVLAAHVAPASLCAVVKAGGYGHGAPEVARAALEGGATWLAVALVEEGHELREAGIDAPVLLLSEPAPTAMGEVVDSNLTPTLYTFEGLAALLASVRDRGFPVHVKVDTGMHRVGATPADAVRLATAVASSPELSLQGFWTHFAVSDEVDNPYTADQVAAFRAALAELENAGVRPRILHAANSGGALWHPDSWFDLVRCGIALYGLAPDGARASLDPAPQLRPAMSLKAKVSYVKKVAAGERLSYGLRYQLDQESVVATVPLGYADGVTRGLSEAGGSVLIAGERRPIAGTVTMDQILVDCGPASDVAAGDEVVLFGQQGDAAISAWEWADLTGTIAYEVVCGISERVPRTYVP